METLNSSLPRTHFLNASVLQYSTFNRQLYTLFKKPSLPFSISCKLRTSQDARKKNEDVSKKIVFLDAQPTHLKKEEALGKIERKRGVFGLVKRLPRKVLAGLSNLPLAIGEMFSIAALMALGISPCSYFILLFFFLIFTSLFLCSMVFVISEFVYGENVLIAVCFEWLLIQMEIYSYRFLFKPSSIGILIFYESLL